MKIIFIFILTFGLIFAGEYKVVDVFDDSPVYKKRVNKIKNKNSVKTKKVTKKLKKRDLKRRVSKKNSKKSLKSRASNSRAKLAIIIDDISHKYQLNMIKSLPFKVTPSIFPPSRMNMHTPKLAKGLKHFIVHLPLESKSKAMNRMYKTLFVKDSNRVIIDRVKFIKKIFPNVKYINNHTGSVFSRNYKKSRVLFKALMDNDIKFIDSRTTQNSKFKKISKEFGVRYLHNEHFIDNKVETKSILKEIKKGVALAKKRGYAIIIGHPHMQTFNALKLAKRYFKDIDVVYIDEL